MARQYLGALCTQVPDTNYTCQLEDRIVAITSITATRTITLPLAAQFPQGVPLRIIDISGSVSSTINISIGVQSANTINGASSATLWMPYSSIELLSNGNAGWIVDDGVGCQSTGISVNRSTGAPAAVNNANLILQGTVVGAAATIFFDTFSGSATAGGYYSQLIYRNSRGTVASPAASGSGDVLGLFAFRGYNGSAFTGSIAGIFCYTTQAYTTSANGTQLQFRTTPNGATSAATAMTIDQSGFLGIGTTTPAAGIDCPAGPIRPYSNTVANIQALTAAQGAVAGAMAYATNACVFNGQGVQEATGKGTGGLVSYNGTAWRLDGTNVTMSA